MSILVFDLNAFNHALLCRASVVNSHLLTGPQRGGHDLARAIDDARSRAKRKTDRSLLAFDHDRLTGLVGSYGAR